MQVDLVSGTTAVASVTASVGPPPPAANHTIDDSIKLCTSIWNGKEHIEWFHEDDQEQWRCKWCNTAKKHWRTTKALNHICKLFEIIVGVALCLTKICLKYLSIYQMLRTAKINKKKNKEECRWINWWINIRWPLSDSCVSSCIQEKKGLMTSVTCWHQISWHIYMVPLSSQPCNLLQRISVPNLVWREVDS